MKKQTIKVFTICKRFYGHGHYRITIEYNENGIYNPIYNKEESFITTDMECIDIWYDGGAEKLARGYLMQNINSEAKIIFDF
jgi:hypothetical protein